MFGLRAFLGQMLLPQGLGQPPHPRLSGRAGIRVAEAQVVLRGFGGFVECQPIARQIDVRQEYVTLPLRLDGVQIAQGVGVGFKRALTVSRLGERPAAPKMPTRIVKKLAHTAPFRVVSVLPGRVEYNVRRAPPRTCKQLRAYAESRA